VLTKIAEVIRASVRETDLLGRWGGEEFVIILPETEIGGGLSLAEKMRARLESADLGDIGAVTASFGVTPFAHGDDIETIMARVDAGLYAAKQGGRNRVEQVLLRSTPVAS
jgi:diguanylate cyclase (GGDEF)-like protein